MNRNGKSDVLQMKTVIRQFVWDDITRKTVI